MQRKPSLVLGTLTVICAAAWLIAGPLNPPAGPVASTYKTLTEVEPRTVISSLPYTIAQPGSYYLSGNLTGVQVQSGIIVNADNVTIDLNGFTITGVASSNSGINVGPGTRVCIRNGCITGWGSSGITSNRPSTEIDQVNVRGNAFGISVGDTARITRCQVDSNLHTGISAGNDSSVLDCSAKGNGSGQGEDGIFSGSHSIISRCVVTGNAGHGIGTTLDSRITDCSAATNYIGIRTNFGGLVTGCICSGNTTDGIEAGDGAEVRSCVCSLNGDDGIQIGSDCTIVGNTCYGNGTSGAGVYVLGASNRIEDNHLNTNHWGILVPSGNVENFIVKNDARSNTINYSVGTGNQLAPIITNPSANSFATMGPWNNVAH